MPKPVTFEPGAKYVLDRVGYEVLDLLDGGSFLVLNVQNQRKLVQSAAELWKRWEDNALAFVISGENLREEEGTPFKTSYAFADLASLPPAVQKETWHRYLLIQPLLDLPSRKRTLPVIQQRIQQFYTDPEEVQKREGEPVQFGQRVGKGRKCKKRAPPPRPSRKKGGAPAAAHGRQPEKAQTQHYPDPRTVRRWLRRFERGYDIRSLAPSYHDRGPQERHLPPVVEELLKQALKEVYYTEQRASVQQVIHRLKALVLQANQSKLPDEQLKVPSDATIYRYVEDLDQMEVAIARFGRAQAERMHGQTWQGPRPTRPNQRWQFDFTKLDVLVVDGADWLPIGRPVIAAIRDVYTGYPVGIYISFDPPSYRLVMECLLYACLRKTHVKEMFQTTNDYLAYGIPEVLVVDNAIELNRGLEWACLQLGIELQHAPVRMPWFKGAIERWFRTLNQELIHNAPGTTFSRCCQWRGYDPRKHASMTLDGLWEALHLWIVDDYTQSVHHIGEEKGIPAKRWLRALEKDFVPRLPPSRNDLLVLVSRRTTRTVGPHGIEFENLYYQSEALRPLRSRLERRRQEQHEHGEEQDRHEAVVEVKYHPGDLGRIWVLDPFEKDYIEVRAVNWEYARGLSLWKHRVIKRYTRRELQMDVDDEALILARARLQARLQQEFRVARTLRTRVGSARFLDIQVSCWMRGMPSSASTIQVVEVTGEESATLTLPTSGGSSQAAISQESATSLALALVEHAAAPPPPVPGVTLLAEPESGGAAEPPPPAPPQQAAPQGEGSQGKGKGSGKREPAQPQEAAKNEPEVVDFSQFGITASYIHPERLN